MKKSITTFVASIITLLCFGQAKTYFHDRIDTTVFAVADTVGHGANNYYATNTSPDFNVNHYENGLSVILFVKKGNTGTATLTLVTRTGTLSTRSIRKAPGAVLASGDIKDSSLTLFTYYNGHWRLGDMVPASSSSWMLTGNAGTTAGTNFLGTTDAQDMVFKRNSSEVMRLYSANNYVGIGLTTPTARLNVLGSGTTTVTYAGLFENSSGMDLFAVRDDGFMYGGNATTKSLIVGQNSSASMALSGNTFFGVDCGKTGNFNVAMGFNALQSSTGDQSVAIGSGALQNATAGFNVAVGKNALVNTIGGFGNVAVGNEAGTANVSGNFNLYLGYQSGYHETGSSKLFIDNNSRASEADGRIKALIYGVFDAAVSNQTLRFNASVGVNSAPAASTAFTVAGFGSTSATYTALFENSAGTDLFAIQDDGNIQAGVANGDLTIGFGSGFNPADVNGRNTFYGYNIATALTTGFYNTFAGYNAGKSITSGGFNTAFGQSALLNIDTENSNDAFGHGCMQLTTNSTFCSAFGSGALSQGTGSDYCTAIGQSSLRNSTGDNNTALGFESGYSTTSGTGNVFLGYQAGYFEGATTAGSSNKLYIDNTSRASEADARVKAIIYGIFNATVTSQELHFNSGIVDVNGRLEERQGTDVASSSTITLTYTGNTFELTGTTAVDFITTTGWQEGSEITLIANENVTINDDAGGGNLRLAGNANFAMTADDVLTLVYSSTTAGGIIWREKSRSVN